MWSENTAGSGISTILARSFLFATIRCARHSSQYSSALPLGNLSSHDLQCAGKSPFSCIAPRFYATALRKT